MSEAMVLAPQHGLALSPVMDLATAKQRLAEFQEFVGGYMKEGEDFGTIPGTPKPTLYKPGADKLCELYGLSDSYKILDKVEDFERGLFDYNIECILSSRRDGSLVSTGLGSCNSYEGRYRWRDLQRVCPGCQKPAIIKGKQEYGGGWVCFKKKGGCGQKFKDGDQAIEGQEVGKVQNDDIATMKNTILKMAKKRAKVDATLAATRSSGVFTQDVEDLGHNAPGDGEYIDEPTTVHEKKLDCVDCKGEIDAVTIRGKFVPLEAIRKANLRDFPDVNLCGKCQVLRHSAKRTTSAPETVEAQPVADSSPDPYFAEIDGKKLVSGTAVSVSSPTTKGKGVMVSVKLKDDSWISCWHVSLHEYLATAKGKRCVFVYSMNGAFKNIEEIRKIGDQEFDGKVPVVQLNDHPGNQTKFEATDDDIPF